MRAPLLVRTATQAERPRVFTQWPSLLSHPVTKNLENALPCPAA